jgi:elongation factor 1-beta
LSNVIASIKVFPVETAVDLHKLRKKIENSMPSYVSIKRFDEEPIAFGLVALLVHVMMPEQSSGVMEEVENALRSIPDVGEIQVVRVARF